MKNTDGNPVLSKQEHEITEAFLAGLRSHSHSDREAFAALQKELRLIAQAKMRQERADHTLQTTALINELFIKVFKGKIPDNLWNDSTQAIRYLAHAMVQILNDHADARNALKRGGRDRSRIPIDQQQAADLNEDGTLPNINPALLVDPAQSETIIAVRDALTILAETAPRQAQVVELLYYGGLTQEEVAAALDLSLRAVQLDWQKAKAFLKVQIASEST